MSIPLLEEFSKQLFMGLCVSLPFRPKKSCFAYLGFLVIVSKIRFLWPLFNAKSAICFSSSVSFKNLSLSCVSTTDKAVQEPAMQQCPLSYCNTWIQKNMFSFFFNRFYHKEKIYSIFTFKASGMKWLSVFCIIFSLFLQPDNGQDLVKNEIQALQVFRLRWCVAYPAERGSVPRHILHSSLKQNEKRKKLQIEFLVWCINILLHIWHLNLRRW